MEYIVDIIINASPIERLSLLIFLLFGTYKGIIKLPFVNFGNKKTHESCNLYEDMNRIIKESVLTSQKISRIKTKEILHEQMNALEVVHNEIIYKMKSIYNSISNHDKDISHYEEIIDNLENDIKNMIKNWFRENHLTEKTESEYRAYTITHVGLIISRVTDTLDRKYKNFKIDRETLYKHHADKLITFAKEKYTGVFYTAREISRSFEEKIKELEK